MPKIERAKKAARPPRPLKQEALWARVDRNKRQLAAFVVFFVTGSAVLLTAALVALPGYLLSWGATEFEYGDSAAWYAAMPRVIIASVAAMLLVGGIMAAVQLSNAEDWVRNRFRGRPAEDDEADSLRSALADMGLAAGLPAPPRLLILPSESVNAFALGTSRKDPVVGVTQGMLDALDPDEERAVVATLVARIIAGDIMFGTALAALMGPLKAIRDTWSKKATPAAENTDSDSTSGSGCDTRGCGRGCSNVDDLGGAAHLIAFLVVVVVLTYLALVIASWIVTIWGRLLHRTSYEKADAEGMLLLKDPAPMLSALGKAMTCSNELLDGDSSYDGILYAAVSGDRSVSKTESRRYRRLCEVLGVDGMQAEATLKAAEESA